MDWSNERYVRWYVRDTKTWMLLGWEGQCVLGLLLRKVDRAGVLDDVRDAGDLLVIFANGMPIEHIAAGLERLVRFEVVEVSSAGIVIPNFIVAQETAQSDAQRARESRERKRTASRNVTSASRNVTDESRIVTPASRAVTPRHGVSQPVTPSVPSVLSDQIPPNPPSAGKRPRAKRESAGLTDPPEVLDASQSTQDAARRVGKDWRGEWAACRDWHLSRGRRAKDWQATLRTWMRPKAWQENNRPSAQQNPHVSTNPVVFRLPRTGEQR